MSGDSLDAVNLAIALHEAPAISRELRAKRMPDGIALLLRVASGQAAAMETACAATAASESLLTDSARFFVEQQLLDRECENDPWRVLGVRPGAAEEQLNEHRRLLLSLVHPDRSGDWAAGYSDRLQRAWRQLKTAEGRSEALAAAEMPPLDNDSLDVDAQWQERAARPVARADESPHLVASHGSMAASYAEGVMELQRPGSTSGSSTVRRISPWKASAAAAIVLVLAVTWFRFDGANERAVPAAVQVQSREAPSMESEAPPVFAETSSFAADAVDAAQPSDSTGAAAAAKATDHRQPSTDQPSSVSLAESDRAAVVPPPAAAPVAPRVEDTPLTVAASDVIAVVGLTQTSPDEASSKDASLSVPTSRVSSASLPEASAPDPTSAVAAARVSSVDGESRKPRLAEQRPAASAVRTEKSPGPMSAPAAMPAIVKPQPELARAAPNRTEENADSVAPSAEPDADDAIALLGRFTQRYAEGDLDGLLGLFSPLDQPDGGASLAVDYGQLFSTTKRRSLALRSLSWERQGGRLVGSGFFEARYQRNGAMIRRLVTGRINVELVKVGEDVRFSKLESLTDAGQP